MTGLDPNSPLVLDTRALHLQRRPGSMITVLRTVPAPADCGVALARVPQGSDIELDLRLESVMEGVWVSGAADIQVEAECARCLEPVNWTETIDLQQMYEYQPTDARGAVVVDLEQDDDPLPQVQDDMIDLEPTLRDAVVLELPLAPLCRSDCAGLCPECGTILQDDPHHAHEQVDPRWAALSRLTDPDSQRGA